MMTLDRYSEVEDERFEEKAEEEEDLVEVEFLLPELDSWLLDQRPEAWSQGEQLMCSGVAVDAFVAACADMVAGLEIYFVEHLEDGGRSVECSKGVLVMLLIVSLLTVRPSQGLQNQLELEKYLQNHFRKSWVEVNA
ncbi:hypothetical protein Droror1_Dr00023913 [Drosera rotundifolia]